MRKRNGRRRNLPNAVLPDVHAIVSQWERYCNTADPKITFTWEKVSSAITPQVAEEHTGLMVRAAGAPLQDLHRQHAQF